MRLRSLQLCFHSWQVARVLECPAASVARGPGACTHLGTLEAGTTRIWQICSCTPTAFCVVSPMTKGHAVRGLARVAQ